jgi:Fe2+ or Zn2+ uptake regulation protein
MKKIIQSIFGLLTKDSYYNTNKESGKTLINSKTKASKQELKVLKFFEARRDSETFSPEDVLNEVDFGRSIPITSVRRAITNLTNAGYLKKTSITKKGKFGKQIHTWQINN